MQYILNSQAALNGRKQVTTVPVDGMCTPWCPADSFCDFFFLIFPLIQTKSETFKDI